MTEPNDNSNTSNSSTTTTTTIATAATVSPTSTTSAPAVAPKKSVVDDFFSALFANNSHSQSAAPAAQAALSTSAATPQVNNTNHNSNGSPAVESSSEVKIEASENNNSHATPSTTAPSRSTTTLASLQQLPAAALQAIGSSSVNSNAAAAVQAVDYDENDSSNQANYKAEIDELVDRSRNYPQYKYSDIDQQLTKDENENDDDDEEDNDQYDDAQDNNQDEDNVDMEQNDNNDHQNNQGRNGVKRERRVLDEFDEYSLLSSKRGRRGSSPDAHAQNRNRNVRGPRIEARDIITSVNNRSVLVDTMQEGGNDDDENDQDDDDDRDSVQNERPQILAKREIDWSNVKPESRMLVRSLPKFIDKQEVMDYFSKYGEVLEVVQKSPFGFVHFENPEACAQAVQVENGKVFKGIVLDLEICRRKPFFARAAEREASLGPRNQAGGGQQRSQASPSGTQQPQQQPQDYQQVPRTVKVEYDSGRRNSNDRNYERPGVRSGYNNASSPPPYSRNSSVVPLRTEDGYRRDGGGYRGNNNMNEYNRPSYARNNNQGYGGGRNNHNDNYGGNSRYNNDGYGARRNNQDMNRGGYNSSGYNSGRSNYNDRNNGPVGGGYNSSRYNNEPIDSGRNYSRYNDNNTNNYSRYNNNNDNYGSRRDNNYGSSVAPVSSTPVSVAAPAPVIPPRQGNQIPLVQIIAWDNVAYGFTDYIERVFSTNNIRAASITLPFSTNTREQIVAQMIMEGVKAIVMIDRRNENLNKVYLQIFLPTEYGQSVQYDEYTSVTAIEAVTLINRTYPSHAAQYSPVVANQYQQQPQQTYQHLPPTPQQAPVQHQQAAPAPAAQPPVDLNTLASLYSVLSAPQQQQAAAPATAQPSVQQLLAALMNNQQQQQQPVQQQAAPQQQNIASLISAAGSNPALAQLLAQMSAAGGNNNNNGSSTQQSQGQVHPGYSPSMPNNQVDNNKNND